MLPRAHGWGGGVRLGPAVDHSVETSSSCSRFGDGSVYYGFFRGIFVGFPYHLLIF